MNHHNAHLLICPAGQASYPISLEPNTSLFVGSGANCRIELSGEGVSAIHCRLWSDSDSVLWVQDWNTGQTILNGEPVEDQAKLEIAARLQIGKNEIVAVAAEQTASDKDCSQAGVENTMDSQLTDSQLTAFVDDNEAEPPQLGEPMIAEAISSQPTDESVASQQETGFQYDLDPDEFQDGDSDLSHCVSFGNTFSESENEEVELLKMEVEQLRFELAERDSQLQSGSSTIADEETLSEAEADTLRLVARLEELLEELQSSDERVRGLEELLRVSDEATRAEQEERLQLESWVSEIEQRVAQRESESEAQLAQSQSTTEHLKTQIQQLQQHLQKALQQRSETSSAADKELINDLRQQLDSSQQRFQQLSAENESLRQQANREGVRSVEEFEELERNFMELQVSTSRERAELARERETLTRMKDELEKKMRAREDSDSADSRIRVMREHLKEVHKKEVEERKSRSLGTRISRLLNGSSK